MLKIIWNVLFLLMAVFMSIQTTMANTVGDGSGPVFVTGGCEVYSLTESYCPACTGEKLHGTAYTKGTCSAYCSTWYLSYFSFPPRYKAFDYANYASAQFIYSTTGKCSKSSQSGFYGPHNNCNTTWFPTPSTHICG